MIITEKYVIKFHQNYEKKETGCWEWNRATTNKGYGIFVTMIDGKKTFLRAHRASYQINYGDFDKLMFVCHKCDNPKCVNPEHLYLGTAQDNYDDMVSKGRDNCKRRLTKSDVMQIRDLRKYGMGYERIGRKYRIATSTVREIVKGLTWKRILP